MKYGEPGYFKGLPEPLLERVSERRLPRSRASLLCLFRQPPCGSVEKAQQMANHSDPWTTKLYDRRRDEVSLDEVERILV
jgi:hypothetical protein